MQNKDQIFLNNEPLAESNTSFTLDIISDSNMLREPLARKRILEGKITLNPEIFRIHGIPSPEGADGWSQQVFDTSVWDFYLIIIPFTLHKAPGSNYYQKVTFFVNLITPGAVAFDLFPRDITIQINSTTYYTVSSDMKIKEVDAASHQMGKLISFNTLRPLVTSFGEGEPRFYWTYQGSNQQKEVFPETKHVLIVLRVPHGTPDVDGTISYEVVIAKRLPGMWHTTDSKVDPYLIHWKLREKQFPFFPGQAQLRRQPISVSKLPQIDVCILCALAEEAEMLKEAFKGQVEATFQRMYSTHLKREYDYAVIPNVAGEKLGILVTWLPRLGSIETSLQLKLLLEEFRPRFAAMTGICAGDKEKVKLGDIIVAERAFLYDAGNVLPSKKGRQELQRDILTWSPLIETIQFTRGFHNWKQAVANEPRPPSEHQQRDWLLNALLELQLSHVESIPKVDDIAIQDLENYMPNWRKVLRELQDGPHAYLTSDRTLKDKDRVYNLRYGAEKFPFKDHKQPTVYIAPIASGNAVRNDNPFKEIRQPVRGTIAIDMEGAAFYRTLAEFRDTHCLLVKGVSDYTDENNDDSYHQYASKVSAQYMLAFIREYVTSSRFPAFLQTQERGNTGKVSFDATSLPETGMRPKQSHSVDRADVQVDNQFSQEERKGLNLFYSYASEDEDLCKELEKHLSVLRRQGWIKEWRARNVEAGRLQEEIRGFLERSQIILLLISPNFLASDALYENQLEPALKLQKEGRAHVIPILLRTTGGWQDTPLKDLVVLPRNNKAVDEWRNRNKAFAAIAKEIREIVK